MERRAEREARRIHVDAHDGTVTLTGDVGSWAERTSVVVTAAFTPGVREVEDPAAVFGRIIGATGNALRRA